MENGEIQYPVAEITVAGELKNMFSQIVAVSDDIGGSFEYSNRVYFAGKHESFCN